MSTTTPLRAFHGKQEIKDGLIAQLKAHRAADEIVKGVYWQYGSGCAVGCCTHSNDNAHIEMGIQFGIDESVACLIDRIFEGLSLAKAKDFSLQVIRAIPVGADLSNIGTQMKLFSLKQARKYALDNGKAAIDTVLELLSRSLSGDEPVEDEWKAARKAAGSAVRAAWSAAESAAWSAAGSAAQYAASSAAYSAAYAAWSAADAAEFSADSAANAASSAARAASSAAHVAAYEDSAVSAAWSATRDELLRLLTEAY